MSLAGDHRLASHDPLQQPHYEALHEWLHEQQNESAQKRWGEYLQLANQIWQHHHQLISHEWISAALIQALLEADAPPTTNNFIIDVHNNLSPMEADLIIQLSQHTDVTVLVPRLNNPSDSSTQYVAQAYRILQVAQNQRPNPNDNPASHNDALKAYYSGDSKGHRNHTNQNESQTKSAEGRAHLSRPAMSEALHQGCVNTSANRQDSMQFKKFSSPLAEVKHTVAGVQCLLDQGQPASQIAVAAPDIELYWPVLQAHFEHEGVPVCKPSVTKVHNHPALAQWLALLRLKTGGFNTADVEAAVYFNTDKAALEYTEFQQFYTHMYEAQHLQRRHNILPKSSAAPARDITAVEFLNWALSISTPFKNNSCKNNLPNNNLSTDNSSENNPSKDNLDEKKLSKNNSSQKILSKPCEHNLSRAEPWQSLQFDEILKKLIEKLLTHTDNIKMPANLWLSCLERISTHIEHKLQPANTGGIVCENIKSLHWLGAQHVFILGLSEAQTRSEKKMALSPDDSNNIARDLGLYLAPTGHEQVVEDILWQLQKPNVQHTLMCASTDFEGQPQSPALCWLEAYMQHQPAADNNTPLWHQQHTPDTCQWDHMQQAPILTRGQLRQRDASTTQLLYQSLAQDAGHDIADTSLAQDSSHDIANTKPADQPAASSGLNFGDQLRPALSASALEDYAKCPFIFAAKQMFRLKDPERIDLDIGSRSSGSFMHALLAFVGDYIRASVDWTPLEKTYDHQGLPIMKTQNNQEQPTTKIQSNQEQPAIKAQNPQGLPTTKAQNNQNLKDSSLCQDKSNTQPSLSIPAYDFFSGHAPSDEFLNFCIESVIQKYPELQKHPVMQNHSAAQIPTTTPNHSATQTHSTTQHLVAPTHPTTQNDSTTQTPAATQAYSSTHNNSVTPQADMQNTSAQNAFFIKYKKMLYSFIKKEQERLLDPVHRCIAGLEVPIQASLSLQGTQFLPPNEGEFKFSGSIDRIDLQNTTEQTPLTEDHKMPEPGLTRVHIHRRPNQVSTDHAAASMAAPTNKNRRRSLRMDRGITPRPSMGADLYQARLGDQTTENLSPRDYYIVYDYKSSPTDVQQFSSWLKNNRYQLFLYKEAIEQGFSKLPSASVLKACYYIMKNVGEDKDFFDDHKGLDLSHELSGMVLAGGQVHRRPRGYPAAHSGSGRAHLSRPSTHLASRQDHARKPSTKLQAKKNKNWPDVRQALWEQIQNHLQGIYNGQLGPAPKPNPSSGRYDMCTKCEWKTVCRFQHLN